MNGGTEPTRWRHAPTRHALVRHLRRRKNKSTVSEKNLTETVTFYEQSTINALHINFNVTEKLVFRNNKRRYGDRQEL